MSERIYIETTENGFIVNDFDVDKRWVFNTPQDLASFITGWGIEQQNPPAQASAPAAPAA